MMIMASARTTTSTTTMVRTSVGVVALTRSGERTLV